MTALFYTKQVDDTRRSLSDLPPPVYEAHRDPRAYEPGDGLVGAVNVALILGQPLLVTGEPGTGKTRLAYHVASQLGLGDPLECFVKSTTTAKDLCYSFDELSRFRDIQEKGRAAPPLENYLSFNALGKAILFAGGPDAKLSRLPGKAFDESSGSRPACFKDLFPGDGFPANGSVRTLVLIDELDKAPRDTPNDLLNEIERLGFDLPELGLRVQLPPGTSARPIVIITSNSEKSLPDPFLRRCVFHDIAFPREAQLRKIILKQLPHLQNARFADEALQLFELLRDRGRGIRRPPGTAELLAWLRLLSGEDALGRTRTLREQPELATRFLCILLKTAEDMRAGLVVVDRWLKPADEP